MYFAQLSGAETPEKGTKKVLAVFRCLFNFPLKSVPLAKVSDDCSLLTDFSDLGKPFFC